MVHEGFATHDMVHFNIHSLVQSALVEAAAKEAIAAVQAQTQAAANEARLLGGWMLLLGVVDDCCCGWMLLTVIGWNHGGIKHMKHSTKGQGGSRSEGTSTTS